MLGWDRMQGSCTGQGGDSEVRKPSAQRGQGAGEAASLQEPSHQGWVVARGEQEKNGRVAPLIEGTERGKADRRSVQSRCAELEELEEQWAAEVQWAQAMRWRTESR